MRTPLSMTGACRLSFLIILLVAACLAAPWLTRLAAQAPRGPLLGDQPDGSRARPVHVIPLRDSDGEVIRPTDRPLLPFSPTGTCAGECHDVKKIAGGWHFNLTARRPGDEKRRGEPWMLVDAETATQLPLSYRGWPATFRPEQVGLTPWKFAMMFGGRTPGGLSGVREPGAQLQTRWTVSGELETNCLACHDASPSYDHAEYDHQVRLENFRWAATAASNLGLVTGSAREMPNTFDYLLPFVEDPLIPRIPSVTYAPERFLPGAKVVFDIARDVPSRRCYFCHSTVDVKEIGQTRFSRDEDIHLARGMTCVDCHRNGLDHQMNRGFEGEAAAKSPGNAALTCRGCHMANEADRNFANSRLGAPYPRHAGIPPIHFSKLSCTACHSGPRPEENTRTFKTSQAHRLGGLGVNKAEGVLPHLYYPVFQEQPDRTTTANRLVWPAFWARLSGSEVRPLAPEQVKKAMAKAKIALKATADGNWPALDEIVVARILTALEGDRNPAPRSPIPDRSARDKNSDPRSQTPDPDTFVYIAGGKLHRLDASGKLVAEDNAAAQPYTWPIAHDVRPASQALGARGCTDCHDERAAIFFGKVAVDSPLASDRATAWVMNRFQKSLDTAYVTTFARTFQYRPWLKAGVALAAAILLLFALAYVLSGLQQLSAVTNGHAWLRMPVHVVALGCCAASAITGLPALVSGQKLTGFALMLHVAMVPAFAVGAVLAALFWSHANRFGGSDWERLRRPFGFARPRQATPYVVLARKAAFWVAAAAVLPAMASATLAMFPVLPSVDQDVLFVAHRYSVWGLVVASSVFTACAFAGWLFDVVARRRSNTDPAPATV